MTVDQRTWPELRYKLAEEDVPVAGRAPLSYLNIACVCVLSLLVTGTIVCSSLLWFTNFFDDVIHSAMQYKKGSPFFEGWSAPPFGPTTKLYLYNYTNAEDFLAGRASRLRVKELGPYSYSEALERVGIQFHPNNTMSFSERRAFTFHPEWSRGSEEDIVVVPNLPLICAIARVRDEAYVAQLGLRSALWASGGTAFNTLRVRDYLFGYNDTLYSMAKAAVEMATTGTLPKLGMLAPRVGLSSNVYTVYTGERNHSLQDMITTVNGKPDLGVWKDPECNRVDGSAGTFFPVPVVQRLAPLHLFNADICRRIPLEFKEQVTVMDSVPALRYSPPDNFLDNGVDNPDNACYTTPSYSNVPSGVFLNGPCFMDSPSFISFPRFYLGDPKLRAAVDGIEAPVKEKHEMFFDVHPELGVNLGAATRLQVNVMVRKASLINSYLDNFEDEIIIPILWFETVLTEFPEDVKLKMYHLTFTLPAVERVARYGLPLLGVAFLALLLHRLLDCRASHHRPVPVPVQIVRVR